LPEAALAYRLEHGLTDERSLGTINVTAWLYKDTQGREGVQVNPNIPIKQLRNLGTEHKNIPVGFHSEFMAAEWFRTKPKLRVLEIFTERIPCRDCADFLRHWYESVPGWYYYVDRRSFPDDGGPIWKQTAEGLRNVYGLPK
jgi:hypothetical protein